MNTWRKIHKWLAVFLALPFLFLTLTGIFLQIRAQVPWIQPPVANGSAPHQPTLAIDKILGAAKSVSQMQVSDWADIQMLDLRPRSGIIKIRTWTEMETQIDAKTGAILSVKQRRNDFVAALHDGSYWGLRLWVGLPVAFLTLGLLISGLVLAWCKTLSKFQTRKRRTKKQRTVAVTPPKRTHPFILRHFSWKYHYGLSLAVIFPWMVVTLSGLMLQMRDELSWVTPPKMAGGSTIPTLTFPQLYESVQAVPAAGVKGWEDVWRIYIYPHHGTASVMVRHGARPVETQVDFNTGKILNVSVRARDLLEDIHEGKFYNAHLWWFLPTHLLALLLWLTGVVMAFRPTVRETSPSQS